MSTVKLATSKGDIVVELNEDKAPVTVENFLNYVRDGFYDGTIFHRVIPNFMIQGGGFSDEMIQKTDYDLVLCDIKMPKMDGVEVLQKVQEIKPEIPFIMISGHGELETAVETMRLGAYPCRLRADTVASRAYGQENISERHRHRYEFNNHYREIFKQHGMVLAGLSMDETLVEIIEIADHPWFVGCQFHPEFTSTPRDGHPLFTGFIEAALRVQQGELPEGVAQL